MSSAGTPEVGPAIEIPTFSNAEPPGERMFERARLN